MFPIPQSYTYWDEAMDIIEAQKNSKIKFHGINKITFEKIAASALNQFLHGHAQLITSNQRLSRFRLQTFEMEQLKQGKTAWQTPHILPWSAWLQQQWQASGKGICLSHHQESLLWRECIMEDKNTQVLNPKALSQQAMDAWSILADYHIDPTCLKHAGEEHMALWRWGESIVHKTKHFLQHQILSTLSDHTKDLPSVSRKKIIVLDGFDTFSPAQLTYLNTLQNVGYQIFEVSNDNASAYTHVIAYQDEETELRLVCKRIRSHVEEYPQHHIGVFVPDLERRAPQVSRIFTEELASDLSLTIESDLQGEFFNLSFGSTLAKQSMIQTALTLLSLGTRRYIQHFEISQLLLNPYIAGFSEEAHQRASLDASLRNQNQNQLSIQQLLHICQQSAFQVPILVQLLETYITHKESGVFNAKQRLSNWLIRVEELLNEYQWYEQASLPFELSQTQNWRDMVNQLVSLDDYCGLLTWQEAISRLHEFANEHTFRPAPGTANIQVMGFLEAANLRFDVAFILGMDDATWPAAAKPHPLIPFDIQALHQTPHANSEREWLFAQEVWQNILHVSPTLYTSYAKNQNNKEVQVSPLVEQGNEAYAKQEILFRYAATLQQQPCHLLPIHDTKETVQTDDNIRGGTSLIKAQSNCAFQAFARHRLHLLGLESPSLGLNSREQGTLLHAALEAFWKKTKKHRHLLTLIESNQLESEILASIQEAWLALQRFIPSATQALETSRLQLLLKQWLIFESQRHPFQVDETEAWRTVHIGTKQKILLHTKLDRIDTDQQGNHIILDYKTGLDISPSKAMGERPNEPQISIYYLAEEQQDRNIHALAFAQVRSDKSGFKGFAQESDILLGIRAFKGKKGEPDDWNELTKQWHQTLDKLADEFLNGNADVLPKNSQCCTYCEFSGLCQIEKG